MASSADDSIELDRLADAVVPSFRRKPSMPPPAAAEGAPEAASSPAQPALKLENPEIPAAPRVPDLGVVTATRIEERQAPAAPPASAQAHADRNDATPIDLPQVVLPVATVPSSTSTQPDPHEAATVPPPQPAPAAKPKKQLRSVPEPSVKAEAQLHTPAPRVAMPEDAPKIVLNDPQAPSRLPTMPMSAVRIRDLESNRVTLRPQRKSKAAPLIPAMLAVLAALGIGALLLKTREEREPLVKPSATPAVAAPAPAAAPAAPAVAEPERAVPPPPPADEVVAEETAPAPAPATTPAPAPAPAAKVVPKAAPVAPVPAAAPPVAAPPSAPTPTRAAATPAAPAAAAPTTKVDPAPAPKPAAPAKASNSSAAPAIVRDNPF
jgi:hypothetical protein